MRLLVISDIHGNWEALEAVLDATAADAVDRILVLGDLVGYGASPNEVVERVRQVVADNGIVRGNHDKVVAGVEPAGGFNAIARAAAEWTAESLSAENLEYVRSLPAGPVEAQPGIVICHGSPLDEDEYVLDPDTASEIFRVHGAQMTFFGHTHVPMLFAVDRDGRIAFDLLEGDSRTVVVDPDKRYLVNPGSVGQPRDRDSRAAYLIHDSGSGRFVWRRQEYPVELAQRRVLEAGLPQVLAYRLAAGI